MQTKPITSVTQAAQIHALGQFKHVESARPYNHLGLRQRR